MTSLLSTALAADSTSSGVPGDPVYVQDRGWIVSRHRQVAAVLDDPSFLVPAVEATDSGIGWLRGSVSRFTNGADHAGRRDPPGATVERERQADEAVEWLVAQLGGRHETAVSQLTVFVQACDATAGLIGNSLNIALRLPQRLSDIEGLLAETLRYSPPVRTSRRVASVDNRIGDATIEQGIPASSTKR